MGNQNRLIFIPMRLKNIFNEATASEVIKDLDKVKNDLLKKVDVLVAKKKKLYSNVDIESPMSADEKKLDKEIADLFSDINQLVLQKRSLKKESVNEAAMNPVKKVVNAILKKHGVNAMKTTSTSVKGFHNIENGGYRYDSDYFLSFYKVPQDIIDKVGAEMEKAGVKGVDVRKGIISADFTKTGLKESVNEGLYFVGYNKGRGQGTGVFKDSYSSYKDAKKAVEKIEKERGGSYNQIAYYVADKDGKFVRESVNEEDNKSPEEILRGLKEMAMGDLERIEDYAEMISDRMKEGQELSSWMYSQITLAVDQLNSVHDAMDGKDGVKESVNEGREVKAIQSDFNKTVAAIETELLHYKKTKGTPQEKKHVDNLKKLHPIKKKLEAELESAVSGLYRDAELKIED